MSDHHQAMRATLAGAFILVLIGVGGASGCTLGKPLANWQDSVSSYVRDVGNGDPHVLRDAVDLRARRSTRPAQIRFSRMNAAAAGIAPFRSAVDAEGLLVGVHRFQESTWYVFMVALLQRQPAADAGFREIRLAGFRPHPQEEAWVVDGEAAEPTAVYLAQAGPAAQGAWAAFPGPTDVFELDAQGPRISVRETRSGACWELTLPTRQQAPDPDAIAGRSDGPTAAPPQ